MTPSHADRILIVDDEPANVLLMERLLQNAGYRNLSTTTDSRRVLGLYRDIGPDLILLDLMMPHLDGLAVLTQLKREIPADVYLPILVLTADATPEAKRKALAAGAQDFLTKPFEQFEVLLRIRNLLDARRMHLALEAHSRALEETVRQRTERLLQSEKVAAMGSLLAGVAHELNNPLAVLSGQAQLLQTTGADPATARRALKIGEAADRCVRIVRNFLALARQRPPERTHTSLKQVVMGALELLGYELRSDNVQPVVQLADDLPVMWADPHQLHQVLVNLIANAHQALRRHAQPRRITVIGRHDRAAGRAVLEVVDTGPGIPPNVQAKIFEPFFTTKAPGEGTGLGLSLCRGIVEEHGGTLTLAASSEAGTTFRVELPVVAPPAAAAAGAPEMTPTPLRPHLVLVVDDEAALAEVVAEAVERDGHTTGIAANGVIALEMLAREAYDLIISDTKMPLLDGETFYAELQRRFPRLRDRIIFMTGDVLAPDKREFLERTGAPYFAKPCDLDEIRRTVHRLLAGAGRRPS
jgi:two-component system NtrC family sensor kinase